MKWVENILIFLLHIFYLGWILFVLQESGTWEMKPIVLHFVGMAIYGGLLIRGSAYIIKRRHLIELEEVQE